MRTIDEMTITDAALEQMSSTRNPRLKEIMAAAVRHLHAFAREVDLTPEEWLAGIGFLTAVGQKCTPYRQEFVLLSDTLGLSSLVNEHLTFGQGLVNFFMLAFLALQGGCQGWRLQYSRGF